MPEQCIGNAQVAFGIFKINGVDLMGHGGGTDFTGNGFLLEETVGNIAPDVAADINQDGVVTADGVKQFGHIIMGFDLNGVGIVGDPQRFNKLLCEILPVDVRIS